MILDHGHVKLPSQQLLGTLGTLGTIAQPLWPRGLRIAVILFSLFLGQLLALVIFPLRVFLLFLG